MSGKECGKLTQRVGQSKVGWRWLVSARKAEPRIVNLDNLRQRRCLFQCLCKEALKNILLQVLSIITSYMVILTQFHVSSTLLNNDYDQALQNSTYESIRT